MIAKNAVRGARIIVSMLFVIAFLTGSVHGQSQSYLISQQAYLSVEPRYDHWSLSDQATISQAGAAVMFYAPLGREFSFSLQGLPASTSGDVESLSGLSDAQLGLTWHLEQPDLVFTLGVNVPTGKTKLTMQEFLTSIIVSNTLFDFQTPSFGQGFSLNPGVIWAFPLSDDVVAGLGASFNYRGAYQPLDISKDYDPGDELTASGGLDIRLDESSTLSGDMVFTHYANDQYDGKDIFAAGSKVTASLQYAKSMGQNEFRLMAHFRTRGKNSSAVGAGLVPDAEKIDPDQWEADASYRFRLGESVTLGLVAGGKIYEETPAAISGVKLGALGVAPEFTIGRSLIVPVTLRYQAGSLKDGTHLSGVEAAIGIKALL